MATVYYGHDPRFKRDVAIKVLPAQFNHDPTFRARFQREAETIAVLEHPAIVPVYDFGEHNDQPYLVMRLMTGGSLGDRLDDGPLPLEQCAAVLKRIGSA
jgi:serine/threonine-protein kinase